MKNIEEVKNQRGATAVEFALVLPILLFLVFGSIEFGMLFYNKQVLTNSSREGARAGVARLKDENGNQIPISDIVTGYCQDHLLTFDPIKPLPSVSVNPPAVDGDFQEDLTVTVSYVYDFLLPSLFGLGLETTIRARTVMKMEQEAGP